MFVKRLIGYGIACAIYKYGKTTLYDKNMEKLGEDGGYPFIAAVVIGVVVDTMLLRRYRFIRASFMRAMKVMDPNLCDPRPKEQLTHWAETSPPVVLCSLLASYIFPFPTMVLTVLFGLGQLLRPWPQLLEAVSSATLEMLSRGMPG